MEIKKERLDKTNSMKKSELDSLKVDLEKIEHLDETMDYLMDEVYDYIEDKDEDEKKNKKILEITRFIVNIIQKRVCDEADGVKFADLSKECRIQVIENLTTFDCIINTQRERIDKEKSKK